METRSIVDALAESPVTRDMGRAERRRLAALAAITNAATGDVLLREGTETSHLGIVLSGRVALRLNVLGRGPITILTVEPGDLFGWSAVVPPYRSTSTAVAIVPTEAITFEAGPLREALAADDDLAAALNPRLMQALARRLSATRDQLLDLFGRAEGQAW
ncbi:MAG TPA: Crp/Fnr family transcriptional regulator [Candidatus Limnocylindrales bacterium]|nr:Crp/Fnr family transcriptional regulator [Candidatus Limnocylindrales bacterium]